MKSKRIYKFISLMAAVFLMVSLFTVPVLAVDYNETYYDENTNQGRAFPYDIDIGSASKEIVELILSLELGTLEDVYYVSVPNAFINPGESGESYIPKEGWQCCQLHIYFIRDTTTNGAKGNIAYVKDKDSYIDTDSFNTIPLWEKLSIDFRPGTGTPWISHYKRNDGYNNGYVYNTTSVGFQTNIPIFNTEEGMKKYFADGNLSDIYQNGEQKIEYSADIKAPYEVYAQYFMYRDSEQGFDNYPAMDLNFKSDYDYEKGYRAEIKYKVGGVIFESGVFGASKKNRLDFRTNYVNVPDFKLLESNCIGDAQGNHNLVYYWYDYFSQEDRWTTWPEYKQVNDNKNSISWVSVEYNYIEFWVRIISPDNKASDWAKIKYSYDLDDMPSTWTDQVVNNNTDIVDGNIEPGQDTQDDIKDSYKVEDGQVNTNTGTIIDSIKNGFGLLGDSGLIILLGETFSFIPNEIIILLISTFGAICAVIVIKFVRG